jgi:DNA-binding MarR family transcriptional regulator
MNDSGQAGLGTQGGAEGDVVFALLHAAHELEARLESALESVGLSLAKYGVLTLLADAGEPVSLSQLAARQSCVRSNMTQLVDRLEAEGLVRRVDDTADRRVVLATLTAAGVQRQAAGAVELRREQSAFMRLLPAKDRAALQRVLATISS